MCPFDGDERNILSCAVDSAKSSPAAEGKYLIIHHSRTLTYIVPVRIRKL